MWKWLLYSLILFNVGFFVWNSQRGIPLEQAHQSPNTDEATKLLLLNEKSTEQSELSTTNTAEQIQVNCYSLGPLARKTEARAAQKRLSKWNIKAQRRVQKVSTEGFWVIIPAAKTRTVAKKSVKRLKELGIRDYFLVATGSHKNAISLGVFSKSSSARRRLKAMSKKGVEAVITSVDLPKRSYWLDWPANEAPLNARQLAKLQKTFKGVGKVSIKCSK